MIKHPLIFHDTLVCHGILVSNGTQCVTLNEEHFRIDFRNVCSYPHDRQQIKDSAIFFPLVCFFACHWKRKKRMRYQIRFFFFRLKLCLYKRLKTPVLNVLFYCWVLPMNLCCTSTDFVLLSCNVFIENGIFSSFYLFLYLFFTNGCPDAWLAPNIQMLVTFLSKAVHNLTHLSAFGIL